jgi:HAD superfamily hydrolase (TIGR01509 family)
MAVFRGEITEGQGEVRLHIFDLDGTLIDSNGVWLQIDLDFLRERGCRHTMEYSNRMARLPYRDAAIYTKEYFQLPESPEEIMRAWAEMARTAYAQTIPLKPGVLKYLTLLQSRGARMAIATSCMDDLCAASLVHTGIRPFFSHVVTVREAGKDKRHPDIFLLAAERGGEAPEACTVYEDSPAGVLGAKAAGLRVVGVFDPFFAPFEEEMKRTCDRYIHSFLELP